MKKHTSFKAAIEEARKPISERVNADLMLPRGEQKILQAVSDKVDRGLRVKLLDDGGYDMAYWYKDPNKQYPVEVLVDGESVKKDAKLVEMKFHPEIPEEVDEALVASDMNIFNAIISKIKDDIMKEKLAGKFEKSWPKMQQLAKLAGYGITKKSQGKNKSYIWKLKK